MITDFKLFERKQIGIIYHFTSLVNLYYILKDDHLIAYRDIDDEIKNIYPSKKNKDAITTFSFTRNKNLAKDIEQGQIDTLLTSRIDLDGDSMSDKYKFNPYNWQNHLDKLRDYTKSSSEAEEMIISDSSYLNGINEYITKVTVPPLDYFEIEIEYYVDADDYIFDNLSNIVEHDLNFTEEEVENFTDDRVITKKMVEEVYFFILDSLQGYDIEINIENIN